MHSRWSYLKTEAVKMRKRGASIRDVEVNLGIARSTLSGWFKEIPLSDLHQQRLRSRHERALIKARAEAVKWHNAGKAARLAHARAEGSETLANIELDKLEVIELALAMLYLGEGMKKNSQTAMGNSDPLLLKFFVIALRRLYGIPANGFKCYLHLRADQNEEQMKRYWSRVLGIPKANFGKTLVDKRTAGSPTYPHYKGVCSVYCSRVAIQRKLMYIATAFSEHITESKWGG